MGCDTNLLTSSNYTEIQSFFLGGEGCFGGAGGGLPPSPPQNLPSPASYERLRPSNYQNSYGADTCRQTGGKDNPVPAQYLHNENPSLVALGEQKDASDFDGCSSTIKDPEENIPTSSWLLHFHWLSGIKGCVGK